MRLRSAALCLGLLLSSIGSASGSCYVLFDGSGKVLRRDTTPPFSIAWPEISAEYLASQKRGERLLIVENDDCADASIRQTRASISASNGIANIPDNRAAIDSLAQRYAAPRLKLGPGEFWTSYISSSGGSGSGKAKDVHVNGHWRSTPSGGSTWVDSHMRSRPSR